MSVRFDLVIIGGGPGGYVAALRAAQLGMRVALVERDANPGGACLWRGCIPTKCLLEAAERYRFSAKKARALGLPHGKEFDWKKIQAFKARVVKQNGMGVEGLLDEAGIAIFQGEGRLRGPGLVEIEGSFDDLLAPEIIIATGARPASIPGFKIDNERVLDSTGALALAELPATLGIVGGGVIGVEFATLMASFGVKVSLFELTDGLTPGVEPEIAETLAWALNRARVKVHTKHTVCGVTHHEDALELEVRDAEGELRAERFDKLLIATGRTPQTAGLGLEEVGVEMERGFIIADGRGRTSVEGVWAIGDVVAGRPQLAHAASHAGVIAVETIANQHPKPLITEQIPSVIFTDPEIACVGLTEAEAEARGGRVKVGRFPFAAIGKARVMGKPEGFAKVVALNDKVVGVHIIGAHASDLIGEALVALKLGATLEQMSSLIHPHPTLSEVIGEASLAALDRALHQ